MDSQEQMKKKYATYPTLEVGYKDGSNKVVPSSQAIGVPEDTLCSYLSLEKDKVRIAVALD